MIGEKFATYSLNPAHKVGRHKARVFESVLGITAASAEILEQAVREAATASDHAVELGDQGFGVKYNLPFRLKTPGGSALIESGWIIRRGEDFPRLTSCYIVAAL